MQVYVEYAFIENFLIDGMLLYLAARCSRKCVSTLPTVFSSSLGAAFACVYGLFSVPFAVSAAVKITFGALMCLVVCARMPRRGMRRIGQKMRFWRDYFSYTLVFFALAACLGGTFYALNVTGSRLKTWQIPVCVFFAAGCKKVARRIFAQKKIAAFSRRCTIFVGEKSVSATGFVDSGNRAKTVDGAPVCFVAPELALALIDENAKPVDFFADTVGGGKKMKIFCCSLLIYDGDRAHKIEKAYFAPSVHIGGEYAALLPAECLFFDDEEEKKSDAQEKEAERKNAEERILR